MKPIEPIGQRPGKTHEAAGAIPHSGGPKPPAPATGSDTNTIAPAIDGKDIFTAADQMISGAKQNIKLEMYDFGNAKVDGKPGATQAEGYAEQQKLVPLLVGAAKRGVKVQVILDSSTYSSTGKIHNQEMVKYLKSQGVNVLTYPTDAVNIDHVKLMVIDGNQALIGGMNWSSHSPANHDADVKIQGPVVSQAEHIFDDDWLFSGGKANPAAGHKEPTTSDKIKFLTTTPQEEGGGSNDIKTAVMDGIAGAKKSVHVEMYTFTDTHVVQAMKDAHARGVDVKVIVDPTQKTYNQPAVDELKKSGIDVRWYKADASTRQLLHAKWGVFDDSELIIGSANWTGAGLSADGIPSATAKANHEADVDIKDSATASVFEKQFMKDWNTMTTTTPPDSSAKTRT